VSPRPEDHGPQNPPAKVDVWVVDVVGSCRVIGICVPDWVWMPLPTRPAGFTAIFAPIWTDGSAPLKVTVAETLPALSVLPFSTPLIPAIASLYEPKIVASAAIVREIVPLSALVVEAHVPAYDPSNEVGPEYGAWSLLPAQPKQMAAIATRPNLERIRRIITADTR
jgi:hypothetical protein